MNQIRKIKAIFLLSILLINLFSLSVFSYDYKNHWAEKEISILIDKGIIVGDGNGIRPDAFITRAEIATVINKVYSFTEKAESEFADVMPDKWYHHQMLIAKNAGYIIGDGNQNAYPEEQVTRAEGSVMFARLLKLDITDYSIYFNDSNQIPSWALGSINALKKEKIINGYEDNSFRADHPMTRAEAFVILSKNIKQDYMKENLPKEEDTVVAPLPVKSGSSCGATGNQRGKDNQRTLEVPTIIKVDTDYDNQKYVIRLNSEDNVLKYEGYLIRFTDGENKKVSYEGSGESIDISNEINTLMAENKQPTEEFGVSIKAVAKSGYKDSSYSDVQKFNVINPSLKVPEDIRIQQEFDGDGQEKIRVVWSKVEDVNKYLIGFEIKEGEAKETITIETTKAEIEIPTEYINSFTGYLSFQAISSKENILNSNLVTKQLEVPLYGGIEGNYQLIYNERHFMNIKSNPTKSYKLKRDLTLSSIYEPFEFSGQLIGENSDSPRKITVDITIADSNYTNKPAGLFSFLSGSFRLENLSLYGSVSGKTGVGGFAGATKSLNSDAVITNCYNYAEIRGTERIGGFIGSNYLSNAGILLFQNCHNYGSVKNPSGNILAAGGIVGLSDSNIFNCSNHGTIGVGNYVGGIVGWAYGNVNQSYNKGILTAGKETGGLIGVTGGSRIIKNSYNGNETLGLAGLVGSIPANSSVEIISSYTTSDSIISQGVATVQDSYFKSETSGSKNGASSLTDKEMKKITSFIGFDSGIWEIDSENELYFYPQIKSNLQMEKKHHYIEIYTPEDFLAIKNQPSARYRLMANIKLPDNYVPFEFSGQLIGDNAEELYSITVNINAIGNNVGLFSILSGAAYIKNIALIGSITGSGQNVGGFAGSGSGLTVDSGIENCKNYAVITGLGYVGGFGGRFYNSHGTLTQIPFFKNCINYGEIYANGVNANKVKNLPAGGIAGLSSVNFDYCANYGTISGGINYVGGIAGWSYGNINGCFNRGSMDQTGAGGLIGLASGSVIVENSYNAGVASRDDMGGLIGRIESADKVTIQYCYVTSEFGSSLSNIIYGGKAAKSVNKVYFKSVDLIAYNGGIPLSEEKMKRLSDFVEFDQNIWEIDENDPLYLYPQITDNLQLNSRP